MIFLEPQEYAKIISAINSNYSKYEGKRIAVHLSYGTDNRAYIYYFENRGFNDYIFNARYEIQED